MLIPGTRRSDRVTSSLRLFISGNDVHGSVFAVECRTAVLSRHGARIVIPQHIKPHEELAVRVISTGLEADMRVIGVISETPEGTHYGMQFVDPKISIWQIDFPPIADESESVAKVLLECEACHYAAVVYLREFEVEVYDAQGQIPLRCKQCEAVTAWKLSEREPSPPFQPAPVPPLKNSPPPAPVKTGAERRLARRLGLKMTACVRTATYGDDVVPTENVSKGGLGFKSSNKYAVGLVVEVAVPYSREAANIFSLGRITGLRALPGQGTYAYGVAYLRETEVQKRKD